MMTKEHALAALNDLPFGAVVLLLGAADTGKTTFAMAAVSRLASAQAPVAYIDCDLGQSEIGPPGTVGLAFADSDGAILRSGRDFKTSALAFVGATTPAGHLLESAAAAARMLRLAAERQPRLILIDTPGWVHGPAARAFALRLSQILNPQVIFAFGGDSALATLLAPFHGLQSPLVWQITPDPAVARKSSSMRAARRTARFASALQGAMEVPFSPDAVALCGADLFSGEPLPHHVQQFLARSLRVPVLHAERRPDSPPYVIINAEAWDADGAAAAATTLGSPQMTVVPAKRFARLLVGLVDNRASLIDIGLIARINFAQKLITILTPCRRPSAVAQIWCGFLRVRPDGREIASLRPGDI